MAFACTENAKNTPSNVYSKQTNKQNKQKRSKFRNVIINIFKEKKQLIYDPKYKKQNIYTYTYIHT